MAASGSVAKITRTHWGWVGASITAAGFTVLGLVAWLADYREREDGLRTAARAFKAVGTRA